MRQLYFDPKNAGQVKTQKNKVKSSQAKSILSTRGYIYPRNIYVSFDFMFSRKRLNLRYKFEYSFIEDGKNPSKGHQMSLFKILNTLSRGSKFI